MRVALAAFGEYRQLPKLAGAWFLPIAFFARLPLAMLPLGTLGFVTAEYGSVGTAGLAAGAISIGAAVGGPIIGSMADKFGQRPVLLIAGPLNAVVIMGAVLLTRTHPAVAVLLVAYFLTGCTVPQASPLARVRWISLTRQQPSTLPVALSYESTADEISFVLGPALVGILAAVGGPIWPLPTAAVITAIFVTGFALHRTAHLKHRTIPAAADPADNRAADDLELDTVQDTGIASVESVPVPFDATHGADATAMPAVPARRAADVSFWQVLRIMSLPSLGMLCIGVFFGGNQASVTGFADQLGETSIAGLLYAIMGVGSAITALAVVLIPERFSLLSRWTVLAAGLALSTFTLPFASTLPVMIVCLILVGLFVGPTIVTIFSVGSTMAPVGREGVAMTLLQSANVVGVAIGSAISGVVVDASGAGHAFFVPAIAATGIMVTGLVGRATHRRQAAQKSPTVAG